MALHKSTKHIIIQHLRSRIRGAVISDKADLKKYSHDMSIFELCPLAVLIVPGIDEICHAVKLLKDMEIPITVRGGGSGTAGACLSDKVVIALERNKAFTDIGDLSFNGSGATVTASAGVIHSHLQDFLKMEGYYLPADPSSGSISVIGGNIATKASGPHAFRYGSIDKYIQNCTFINHEGEVLSTKDIQTVPKRLINQLNDLERKIQNNKTILNTILSRKPKKIASGYNLYPLCTNTLSPGTKISRLLAGSVGTLGIITDAELSIMPYINERATVMLSFSSLTQAGEAVQLISKLEVAAIEIISAKTLQLIKEKGGRRVPLFPNKSHILIIDLEGPDIQSTVSQIEKIVASQKYNCPSPIKLSTRKNEQEQIWSFRKGILPRIFHFKKNMHALSVVNDIGLDPSDLARFIPRMERLFKKYNLEAAIYGHAGSGNLHLRPLFDVTNQHLKTTIQKVADEVYSTLLSFGGTITAEHGMGPIRAPYLKQEWGEEIYSIMKKIKSIFDPNMVFNSKSMFSNQPITDNMKPF